MSEHTLQWMSLMVAVVLAFSQLDWYLCRLMPPASKWERTRIWILSVLVISALFVPAFESIRP